VAAQPDIGRATRVERPVTPGADAAGDLYERYSPQIFTYCLHQLGSREEAEDAVQTTFMNAFRGLSRGIVPELESAWLFKIAHNVCLSRRRSSWRRGRVEAPNNFEVLQEIIPGRERVADELIRLQDVLEEMPENQRRAILLREWQGLTYREISDELGLSQPAVETLIFRARRALAQGLEQDGVMWKKRLRRGANLGGLVAWLKLLVGGGGAATVKVAATALAVATATVAGASEMNKPTHPVRHASVPRHTAVAPRVVRKFSVVPVSKTPSASTARKSPAHQSASPARHLPRPVALPHSQPAETTSAPAAPAEPAPAPPAPAPAESAPAPQPAAPPAPASEPGNGKGKNDKLDRRPQSTDQPGEPAPPIPEPPVAGQPLPGPTPPGQEKKADKPDKPDHPNNGNGNGGHGNGNGNGNK
jgi:RNA polymerase sigma factor (sigma-70 family)